MSKIKTEYFYHTNCIMANGADVLKMVDMATEITYGTIKKHIESKELANVFPDYKWQHNTNFLSLKDDWAVSYYRSEYKSKPCYYIEHSSIEYIFLYTAKSKF